MAKKKPQLSKDEDEQFPIAAAAAKEYLENHRLLQFVRALLQTVIREQPEDPFAFISEQFRNASAASDAHSARNKHGCWEPQEPSKPVNAAGRMHEESNVPIPQHQHQQTQGETNSNDVISNEDLGELKLKGQSALNAVFSSEDEPEMDVGTLKTQAHKALLAALLAEAATNHATNQNANEALESAIISKAKERGKELSREQLDNVKKRAQAALSAALMEEGEAATTTAESDGHLSMEELDELKLKAQSALNGILTDDNKPDMNVGALKAQAREALDAALLAEAAAQRQDATSKETEQAKADAREALEAAMLFQSKEGGKGLSPGELDDVKKKAQAALSAVLMEERSRPRRGEIQNDRSEEQLEKAKKTSPQSIRCSPVVSGCWLGRKVLVSGT